MRQSSEHFEPDASEVSAARHFAAEEARQWGVDTDVVALVVSELAANAVLHARSEFTVSLCLDGERVVVEVADENPRVPFVPVPQKGALSGRGLLIVQRLARAWGVREGSLPGTKVVWAELEA